MKNAMEPGRVTFDDKMVVRRHIEDAGISYTYVSANCFAGYMLGGLCQPGWILPSKDSVTLLGNGDQKCQYVAIQLLWVYFVKRNHKFVKVYIFIYILVFGSNICR